MKIMMKVFVLMFLFSVCHFLPGAQADGDIVLPNPDATISMDLQNAGLKDILKVFSVQSGLNFIASEAVQDRLITLYLDKVPLKDAIEKLFKANNLSFELEKGSNIFLVKDWGKPRVQTVTKVFYLKHASVSTSSLIEEEGKYITTDSSSSSGGGSSSGSGGSSGSSGKWKQEETSGLTASIKKLLTPDGTLIEDYRTNSLIVTDVPMQMEIIAQTIASLDVAVPQIMIEVEMLDVSKNIVDKLGFDWSNAGAFAIQVLSASRSTGFPISNWINIESLSKTVSPGTVSFPNTLKLIFDYLRTQTDTKFLARPRLLTLNNEPAEIKIATNESIGVTTTTASAGGSSGTTTAEAERSETGVIFRVTPQVNLDANEITMFLYPKVSEAIQGNTLTNGGQTYQFRDPEERSTKSVVRIKDGETVIIGGLIRNEFSQVSSKVPVLGDLPLVGALFRHKGGDSDKNKERELLIFITPHIVRDTPVKLAEVKKIVLPVREQSALTGFDRQAVISASLNNFEPKK